VVVDERRRGPAGSRAGGHRHSFFLQSGAAQTTILSKVSHWGLHLRRCILVSSHMPCLLHGCPLFFLGSRALPQTSEASPGLDGRPLSGMATSKQTWTPLVFLGFAPTVHTSIHNAATAAGHWLVTRGQVTATGIAMDTCGRCAIDRAQTSQGGVAAETLKALSVHPVCSACGHSTGLPSGGP